MRRSRLGLGLQITCVVAGVMVVSAIVMSAAMSHISRDNAIAQQTRNAQATIAQFSTLRKYYTANVVAKVKGASAMRVDFNHATEANMIPLPATMILDLSSELGRNSDGVKINLYSSHPFPNRAGRVLDDYQRAAIAFLAEHPDSTFIETSNMGGSRVVRVSVADRMTAAACVNCHNSHPDSPKRDWKLNDVRGILEVSAPLDHALAANAAMTRQLLIYQFLAALCAVVALYFVVRAVTRGIGRSVLELSQSTEGIAQGASEISQASQSLAEASTEQTAVIEHTNENLRDIAATASNSADHSREADALMVEMQSIVSEAESCAGGMETAMGEIKSASDQTSKIIRTIDEIAFQTNLLALNAAVEAARAGDAGRGFAVVAEEVRSLAMRSAEAAQSTSTLIASTLGCVSGGVSAAGDLQSSLTKVAEATSRTSQLVKTIAAVSGAQTESTRQAAQSIEEMTRTTQINAAASEENAATSEELYSQIESMRAAVANISTLVYGSRGDGAHILARR